MGCHDAGNRSERGAALVLVLLILTLLGAMSGGIYMALNAEVRQASFFYSFANLRRYAESGIDLALHDIRYGVTATPGLIGTPGWSPLDDTGHDGLPGTGDKGEGDGLPTFGEPNVYPVLMGRHQVFVYVEDLAGATDTKRIVSSATDGESISTVERYVRITTPQLPRVGALYVAEGATLLFHGQSFSVEGKNHSKQGSVLGGGHKFGITTKKNGGLNKSLLESQIDASQLDQIDGVIDPSLGIVGTGSIAEVDPIDYEGLYSTFRGLADTELPPGTYSDLALGDPMTLDYQVTYVTGDVHLSGNCRGAGILLVDGDLDITGGFTWYGIILLRGSFGASGGGAKINVYGTVIVETALDAVRIDPVTLLSGTATVAYSSEVLDEIEVALKPKSLTLIYYTHR